MSKVMCSNGGMDAGGRPCPSYSEFEVCCRHLSPAGCPHSIIPVEFIAQVSADEVTAQVAADEFKRFEKHQLATDTKRENPLDVQVGGEHYKKLGQYQPWQVLAACMTLEELRGYMKGTVIAYLMRERDKGGDTDIRKALHTIQLWEELRKDK